MAILCLKQPQKHEVTMLVTVAICLRKPVDVMLSGFVSLDSTKECREAVPRIAFLDPATGHANRYGFSVQTAADERFCTNRSIRF